MMIRAFFSGCEMTEVRSFALMVGLFATTVTLNVVAATPDFQVLVALRTHGGHPDSTPVQDKQGNLYGTTKDGGDFNSGVLYRIASNGEFAVLHHFAKKDGASPSGGLQLGPDGSLYGTTLGGGQYNAGTVYKLEPDGHYTILHEFDGTQGSNPAEGVAVGTDASLYGTTRADSAPSVVYKIDGSGRFSVLHTFVVVNNSDPYQPNNVVLGPYGALYGTTNSGGTYGSGVFYTIDTAGDFRVVRDFDNNGQHDGRYVFGPLVANKEGAFFMTTPGGGNFDDGAIYRIDPAGNLITLHSFSLSDGASPVGQLSLGDDGIVYGTTTSGGALAGGTIFGISPSGQFRVLFNFHAAAGQYPASGVIHGVSGDLYGASGNSVYRVEGNSGNFLTLHKFELDADGTAPTGLGTDSQGNYYVQAATAAGNYAIFRIDTHGSYRLLHRQLPFSSSLASIRLSKDGSIYGMSTTGGIFGYGLIYQLFPDGRRVIRYNFTQTEASWLSAGATISVGDDGSIFGTCRICGASTRGAIFKVDTKENFSVLYNFVDATLSWPSFPITPAKDGSLYGVTRHPTVQTSGAITYRLDASGLITNTWDTSFATTSSSSITLGADGSLYGTTASYAPRGVTTRFGKVFKIDPAGTLAELHTFSGNDGNSPMGVVIGTDGSLFGATRAGGPFGHGVVYTIDTNGAFRILRNLETMDGEGPTDLSVAPDGTLFGTTQFGGQHAGGTVFRMRFISASDPTLTIFGATDQSLEATGPTGAIAKFTVTAITETGATIPVACIPGSGSTFPLGQTTVTCTAQSGNTSASARFKVTVQDTTPPVMTLPAPINTAASTVTFKVLANDTVSGSVPVVCRPDSGDTFPIGPTTVACEAIDGAGNRATGSFLVTVARRWVVANDDRYGTDRHPIWANRDAQQTIEVGSFRGVLVNDLPYGKKGRTVALVSGPQCTTGVNKVGLRLKLEHDGSFMLRLSAPTSARTEAERQLAKRGTYVFRYRTTYRGVTSEPATVQIIVR